MFAFWIMHIHVGVTYIHITVFFTYTAGERVDFFESVSCGWWTNLYSGPMRLMNCREIFCGGGISKKYEFTRFDEIIKQLYRWDHKYFYQVMHSDQEDDAAESVSPTMSDLFGNGGVSEGDESVVGDQIVPYVAPISSEEKKRNL